MSLILDTDSQRRKFRPIGSAVSTVSKGVIFNQRIVFSVFCTNRIRLTPRLVLGVFLVPVLLTPHTEVVEKINRIK